MLRLVSSWPLDIRHFFFFCFIFMSFESKTTFQKTVIDDTKTLLHNCSNLFYFPINRQKLHILHSSIMSFESKKTFQKTVHQIYQALDNAPRHGARSHKSTRREREPTRDQSLAPHALPHSIPFTNLYAKGCDGVEGVGGR